MLFKVLIWAFVIGFLYRVLVRFVLPVVQVTKAASDRMRQMQNQINDMDQKMNNASSKETPRVKEGDYIDYEEIK